MIEYLQKTGVTGVASNFSETKKSIETMMGQVIDALVFGRLTTGYYRFVCRFHTSSKALVEFLVK